MNYPIVTRLVPTVSRLAVRASPARQSFRPLVCQWKAGARRPFSARSSLLVKKYTEDHEWIELDGEGKFGTIGITEYAAKQLGDVVFVELPELGLEVNKGDAIGAVESVKSASDIMTPVSGTITESNSLLEEKPGTINKGPESDGWLAKIEVKDAGELESLMDKEAYTKFSEEAE